MAAWRHGADHRMRHGKNKVVTTNAATRVMGEDAETVVM